MSEGGRHQLGSIERLLRILAVLEAAGSTGMRQDRLLRRAGYDSDLAESRRLLSSDVAELNRAGWEIVTVGPATNRRYMLTACGTRVPVRLDREQDAVLARAERLVAHGRRESSQARRPMPNMTVCVRAVATRALLTFRYRGRMRRIHPRAVQPGPSGWYLVGCEDDGRAADKYFVVDGMTEVELDAPGTAAAPPRVRRGHVDPLTWLVDPPEEVRVETSAGFAPQVERALGPAMRREQAGDRVVLTIPVTHQAAFRRRLYPLGARVDVLGPERVRAGIVAELAHLAGT